MKKDCLFCKIAAHEIPAKIRYEDDEFIAFDDLYPDAKIHILIIPKTHFDSVLDLDEKDACLAGRLLLVANKIAKELSIDETGFRLVTNTGKDAAQAIKHLHFHLLGGNLLISY